MSQPENAIDSLVIVPLRAESAAAKEAEESWRAELASLGGEIRVFVDTPESDTGRGESSHDVVVLDWSGAGDDDPSPMVRTRELAGFAPIVAVIPERDHPRAKIASRLGAKAVLAREPREGRSLAERVQHVALSERMISELRAVRERTRRSATRDSLTGLVDRVSLVEMLDRTLANRERKGGGVGLLLIDLDDFAAIDHRIGRPASDELLRRIAERIRQTTRRGDTAARFGGDEFAVVLASPNDATAPARAADRILASIREPLSIHGCDFEIHASVGIATVPGDGLRCDELIRSAERALFHAKQESRGSHRHADRELGEAVARVVASEGELRRAVLEDRAPLGFAPQLDVLGGEVRVFHSSLDASPGFTACLASDGLLSQRRRSRIRASLLGWHVRGLRELLRTNEFGGRSGSSTAAEALVLDAGRARLSAEEFAAHASVLLELQPDRASGASGNALGVEVEFALSEVASDELDSLQNAANSLAERGIALAMRVDGASSSTLELVRTLPLAALVIDCARIENVLHDELERTLAEALVRLAGVRGLRVVAEGVASAEQRDLLIELGCREMRGPLFGKSIDTDELRVLFERLRGGASAPWENALPPA